MKISPRRRAREFILQGLYQWRVGGADDGEHDRAGGDDGAVELDVLRRVPADVGRQIINPAFNVGVWDGTVDICLPYVKGYVPPYYTTIINYTVPNVQGYTTEQTHEGWMVTFSTSLFSASTYTFTFEIFSRTGGANLTITNPWYNPVEYSGTISQLY